MNKSYLNFMLGVIVSSIVYHFAKTPPTWTSIITISIITIILTFDKLSNVVTFFFLTSMVIYQPICWSMGIGKWWEVLFEIWFIVILCYDFFPKKQDRPLFVDYGDITRFPVEFKKTDKEERKKTDKEERIDELVNSYLNRNTSW